MAVKLFDVFLKKPVGHYDKTLPNSVKVTCIVATEVNAPPDVEEPLHWVLLTSLPLRTLEDAIYSINVYSTRWVIEEFHKVLKSGAIVEKLQSDFVLFVALLGGFMGRKCDGNPGTKVIWQGLRKLEDMVEYHNVYQELTSK
jgi:hypothetical protein